MPRVIPVIESDERRGVGDNRDDVVRVVRQYHTLDGEFLAEVDPFPSFRELLFRVREKLNDEQRQRFAKAVVQPDEVEPVL